MMQAEYARPIPGAVATAGVNERVSFIRKTYAHLGGAIALFILLEYLFLTSELGQRWAIWAVAGGRFNWLIVLVAFMAVGYLAQRWAQSDTSRGIQYVGLGLYVVAETVIFAPLLLIASLYGGVDIIAQAGLITMTIFAGLTGTVILTKKDFSFLRGALVVGSFAALGVIIASMIFGFALGTIFAGVMILLAAGYILYDTSQVFAYYRPTQYVAAALALFASVALLFWYVLQFLMSLSRD